MVADADAAVGRRYPMNVVLGILLSPLGILGLVIAHAVMGVHVLPALDVAGRNADVLPVLHHALARGDVGAGDLVEQGMS